MNLIIDEARLEDLLSNCRNEWRQLASGHSNDAPFLNDAWIESFCKGFPDPQSYFLAAREGGELVGLAPLAQTEERWLGQRVRILQALCNVWSYRYAFLAPLANDDVLRALWKQLLTAGQCDVIRLDHMPEGSRTMDVGAALAREYGWTCAILPIWRSPWRAIPVPPNRWDHGLGTKFKSNLRNREKRLNSVGPVDYQVTRDPGNLPVALQTFYELEASGWKGEAKTAISKFPSARTMFDGIVTLMPGAFWVPILSVGGTPIAAQLIQIQHDTMYLLKVGYNPEYRAYSPGQLIMARSMAYGMQNGMRLFDFLGGELIWKSDWCSNAQPNYRMLLFAPTKRGRLAYWFHYGLKECVRKIPGATNLVNELRELRSKA